MPASPFRAGPSIEQLDPRLREVDRCPSCQGVWFDRGEMTPGLQELARIDPAPSGSPLPEPVVVASRAPIDCLRCSTEMESIKSAAVPTVIYDKCPRCHGVWFDRGELRKFAGAGAAKRALFAKEFP